MALLTADEVRDHVESDLVDDALQRIIDAADAEIIRRLGALASQTEVIPGDGLFIYLARKASSVTSITERYAVSGFSLSDLALAASDYDLLDDGYRIERLTTGTNAASRWNGQATVVYVPQDRTAERKMLLVQLVKSDLKHEGHLVATAGDVKVQQLGSYAEERASLFRALGTGGTRLIT